MLVFGLMMSLAATAQAVPIASSPYTDGRDLYAAGTQWKAVFLYADANDESVLKELETPTGVIFNNQTSAIGSSATYASSIGDSLVFRLKNRSQGLIWDTGATSTNVAYYDFTNLANLEAMFAVNLSAIAEAALAGLTGDVMIIGFEDRILNQSDKDFNDLIFAFSAVKATQAPEPATILLFGLGLLGIAGARRAVKK